MSGTRSGEMFRFNKGDVVQEFGYDDDVDFDFRDRVEALIGEELEDEDFRGVADAVIAWWRSDDGDVDDLTDYLVDCAAALDSGAGDIWLSVPAAGSQFHVSASDVDEAAKTAGQSVTTSAGLKNGWTAFHIISRGR